MNWTQFFPELDESWRETLAPATHFLFEWTDYWLEIPDATRLRIGNQWLAPTVNQLFRVRFENQTGLSTLQPFQGDESLSAALHVEVLSRKFPTPQVHHAFFSALLNDLTRHCASLPFAPQSPTQRNVAPDSASSSPLFALHFFLRYSDDLRAAWHEIARAPHHELRDETRSVLLGEATEANANVLLDILQSSHNWQHATGFALAQRLENRAPSRIRQCYSRETFDTVPNRFLRAFLHKMSGVAQSIVVQKWWPSLTLETQHQIHSFAEWLQEIQTASWLEEVGEMSPNLGANRVLEKRRGYREMAQLWPLFRASRRTLWQRAEEAISVRDIARLYETWTFFALVEKIADATGETPQTDVLLNESQGLQNNYSVRFGDAGTLIYNLSTRSYVATLRPDFTWIGNDHAVVFDAKFRLERASLASENDERSAARSDLYKMHAYRDALGVRAAVALYPGTLSRFYDTTRGALDNPSWRDILQGDLSGIGALSLIPITSL